MVEIDWKTDFIGFTLAGCKPNGVCWLTRRKISPLPIPHDAEFWFTGIDQLREFGAEVMVNAHGRPTEGAAAVENVLVSYRDAIQYVHEQSVRAINKGMRPFEMIEAVKFPKHLANHPWLGEFYGTASRSVQQQYSNYIGFYHADPWQLEPMQYNGRAA